MEEGRVGGNKTQRLYSVGTFPGLVDQIPRNICTADDGKYRDEIESKGALCAQVACNFFTNLARYGIPLAFREPIQRKGLAGIRAHFCRILPWEVVNRAYAGAKSSYLLRYPDLDPGPLEEVVCELFLKTQGGKFRGITIGVDDPFVMPRFNSAKIALYHPKKPFIEDDPIMLLDFDQVFEHVMDQSYLHRMRKLATQAFLINQATIAWASAYGIGAPTHRLEDSKVEFGLVEQAPDGSSIKPWLAMADLLSPDEMRVWNLVAGRSDDKQPYRDGKRAGIPDDELFPQVIAGYTTLADITELFPQSPLFDVALS